MYRNALIENAQHWLFTISRDFESFCFSQFEYSAHSGNGPLGIDIEVDTISGFEFPAGLVDAVTDVFVLVVPGGVFFFRAYQADVLVPGCAKADVEYYL